MSDRNSATSEDAPPPQAERQTVPHSIARTSPPPPPKIWTRDGFVGASSVDQGHVYGPLFDHAVGPHVPRRAIMSALAARDEEDPLQLPEVILSSDDGIRICMSGRKSPMPFAIRNVDADELHFVQEGSVLYETEVGALAADRGDFVHIPKSIAYRFDPLGASMRSLIIESRAPFEFVTPYPVGVVNQERDLEYAQIQSGRSAAISRQLVLKAWTGPDTLMTLPYDPLATERHLGGKTPVWKLPMDRVQKIVSLPNGGPPYPFMGAGNGDILLFNMGSRPVDYRPPVHLNADYDEILLFVDGGAWGACHKPGTLTWVPKGVIHHGVSSYTEEPHRSWLLETRATLRWTEAALGGSEIMETATYGSFHPKGE
jgi:homogentisate 1,2-dioxygenase